jgi:hypothetical protein
LVENVLIARPQPSQRSARQTIYQRIDAGHGTRSKTGSEPTIISRVYHGAQKMDLKEQINGKRLPFQNCPSSADFWWWCTFSSFGLHVGTTGGGGTDEAADHPLHSNCPSLLFPTIQIQRSEAQ